jgi:hypothetical protein
LAEGREYDHRVGHDDAGGNSRFGCGRFGPISVGRILSLGRFSNETGTLQPISVIKTVLQLSLVKPKFLNEISGLGGIRLVEEGAGGRARLGREKPQRYNY